jgi:hypothetical protein
MANIIPHGLGAQPKTDAELLALHERYKKQAFDQRWVYERQWVRLLYYVLGRQWIYYDAKRGEWRDKRLAKWVPRPVTNVCRMTEQAIAAMFASIKLGANARPNGNDPKNIIAAGAADQYAPLLHEEHKMNEVMTDFDFWLVTLGNAFMHTFLDANREFGQVEEPVEMCPACQWVGGVSEAPDQVCPQCGGPTMPAQDEMGMPLPPKMHPEQRGQTIALSPLEVAFDLQYAHFTELPWIYRLRWRDRSYYEGHEELKGLVNQIAWSKSPAERTMQIFKSLPLQNDLGVSQTYAMGSTTTEGDGVAEYDLYIKPCDEYPEGYVVRFIGDSNPIVAHIESEALPGPLPYRDAEGNPLWTWTHASYQKVGGRILGTGALDPILQKQDQLNRLDSMIEMIIMRMANPVWLEPKGAEVEKFTGEPGLVVKWNPLTVGGNAKPERIAGEGPHQSLFMVREQYLKDIEELTGTFDVLKGAKPTGVEAFSALQLLVERGQARFANAFMSRGESYKDWFKFALEIEREFGPEERTKAVLGPSKGWMFETFKKTQLQGSVSIVVEDGTQAPKTALGRRAAIEHARQLGALNLADPDQQYATLQALGLTEFAPTLDVQVQAALQHQEEFERWIGDPEAVAAAAATGLNPLQWKRWYDPIVHRTEFLKWANSDRIRRLLADKPEAAGLLDAYLMQVDLAIMVKQMGAIDVGKEMLTPQALGGQPGAPGAPGTAGAPKGQEPGQGAGMAMANSNQNSAPGGNSPQPESGVQQAA